MPTELFDKIEYLKQIEEDATEELLEIPGIVYTIEQSKQRMESGKFVRYEDIKRNVLSTEA